MPCPEASAVFFRLTRFASRDREFVVEILDELHNLAALEFIEIEFRRVHDSLCRPVTPAALSQDGDRIALRDIGADVIENHFPFRCDVAEIGADFVLAFALARKR